MLAIAALTFTACSSNSFQSVLAKEPTIPTLDSGPIPEATTGSTPSTGLPQLPGNPQVVRLKDRQWNRIVRSGVWRPNCPVGRKDLRRLDIDYVNFQGAVKRGSIVAHRDSIIDLSEVFSALFAEAFPIASMRPAEEFDGNLTRMLEANNTSAFNCRRPDQINAPVLRSPHANGRAIDINPLQNPWRDPRCKCWSPSKLHSKDKEGPGVVREETLPWSLLIARGWIWQNIKVPDYMHFDTGYPSRPRASQTP